MAEKEQESIEKLFNLIQDNDQFIIYEITERYPTLELSKLRRELTLKGCATYKAKNVISFF